MNSVIFNFDQIIELAKKFQKMHYSEDMDDYEHGVYDGLEFILFLYSRCEK